MPTLPQKLKVTDSTYYRAQAMRALVEVEACNGKLEEAERIVRAKNKTLDEGRMRVALNNDGRIQAFRADRAYWMTATTMYASLAAMPFQ